LILKIEIMLISASINSTLNINDVEVSTNDTSQHVSLPPKATGFGSSINGGELLMLSLAVCFCNDLYREAKKRNIVLTGVEVSVSGEFGSEGEPGTKFEYKANVKSEAPCEDIKQLLAYTDTVAEVHNTLRKGVSISMVH
jgi:uncharacterized OsmC-like protein